METEEPDLLYSPTMLAEFFSVPVAMIRLLFHCGLIQSVKQVGDIPYCAASDLYAVRQLVSFLNYGISATLISKRLSEFSSQFPEQSPILNYVIPTPTGNDLLIRVQDKLYEGNGQRYFSFDSSGTSDLDASALSDLSLDPSSSIFLNDDSANNNDSNGSNSNQNNGFSDSNSDEWKKGLSPEEIILFGSELPSSPVSSSDEKYNESLTAARDDELYQRLIPDGRIRLNWSSEERDVIRDLLKKQILYLCESAWNLEKSDRWSEACELYRAALLCGGADPAICFQLAELLQRHGDFAGARERYYMVLELDRHYVEAWANLGRVLVQLNDNKEAVDAFERALVLNPLYFEIHYELGVLLLKINQKEKGEEHLRIYLNKVPCGPHTASATALLTEATRKIKKNSKVSKNKV